MYFNIFFFLLFPKVDSYQNTQTRESLSLDYVACLMRSAINNNEAIFPGLKCARDLQLKNWRIIEDCANSTDGSKLLQHHGEFTNQLKPPLTFVPTITFNQVRQIDFIVCQFQFIFNANSFSTFLSFCIAICT